ncbi:dihydrofolate reductase [Xylanimonas oleitrophica]|uniref:Dihydrofolate reductase n=1 Tax=Xylanimonas oleitrophica TaxID=2607479 RepID=A0A2W5WU86_9MICO|nr:dihydrofolate reductase [Xylanimonas oleitrophica]PZR54183.1 dihydrofolate reductase [Xylanimonas oleitrophica]
MIALIWAQARDAHGRPVIGASGTIPWRVPEDFARFKSLTTGHPVVMGRRTWDSLPRKPLPGRTNLVVTRQTGWADDGATRAGSLDEALALAAEAPGGDQVWVLGGGEIYREAIERDLADRIEVTQVDLEVEGDTFAPAVDPAQWRLPDDGEVPGAAEGGWATSSGPGELAYRFRTYVRR